MKKRIKTKVFNIIKYPQWHIAALVLIALECLWLYLAALVEFIMLGRMVIFITLTILTLEVAFRWLVRNGSAFSRFQAFLNWCKGEEIKEQFPLDNNSFDVHFFSFHPFCHFKPAEGLNEEFDGQGFRRSDDQTAVKENILYLAGDCSFFEPHLSWRETLGAQCQTALTASSIDLRIINAGCLHYTMLHCFNRLVIDVQNLPIRAVVLSAGINDVSAFVHSKDGKVPPDYTNIDYPPGLMDIRKIFNDRGPGKFLMLDQFRRYLKIAKYLSLEYQVMELMNNYNSQDNIRKAYDLFHTSYYMHYLNCFITFCKMMNIPLILTTISYKKNDMSEGIRRFIADGIDQVNIVIKEAARHHPDVYLVDVAASFAGRENMLTNKWHFTKEGNTQRAALLVQSLNDMPHERGSKEESYGKRY